MWEKTTENNERFGKILREFAVLHEFLAMVKGRGDRKMGGKRGQSVYGG